MSTTGNRYQPTHWSDRCLDVPVWDNGIELLWIGSNLFSCDIILLLKSVNVGPGYTHGERGYFTFSV